jgi:hypothetical protein
MSWDVWTALGFTGLLFCVAVYIVWASGPDEVMAEWRRQRDRKKIIRERLR